MPICSDGPICWAPLILMVPEVQRSSPAIRRRRVVLPQPDAPTTVMNSPVPTRKLALSRARTRSPEALLNVLETAASSITGVGVCCCDGVGIAWALAVPFCCAPCGKSRGPSKKYGSPAALLARPAHPTHAGPYARQIAGAHRQTRACHAQRALGPRPFKRAQPAGERPLGS